ncbi:hypothetical protein QTP86_022463 [Hemibagrus guttatus]|nr:hypothetical protein QTP86_022463 [Hemibagrus guttatus]
MAPTFHRGTLQWLVCTAIVIERNIPFEAMMVEADSAGRFIIVVAQRMDPATSAAGGSPLQNTSPLTDSAELREIIVRQGAIICSYQDQLEALQTQLSRVSIAAPRDPLPAHGESPVDGSADRFRGFLRQCEVFFSHQPGMYREEGTKCAFLLSLMTDRALEWASAFWDADPQVKSSFDYFARMIRVCV